MKVPVVSSAAPVEEGEDLVVSDRAKRVLDFHASGIPELAVALEPCRLEVVFVVAVAVAAVVVVAVAAADSQEVRCHIAAQCPAQP